jgi:hypothetical protein
LAKAQQNDQNALIQSHQLPYLARKTENQLDWLSKKTNDSPRAARADVRTFFNLAQELRQQS